MQDLDKLIGRIREIDAKGSRIMIAIAGPPASGKSFLSERLRAEFASEGAEIIPLDGFHYDNLVLDQMGLRHRKGAPETFDFDSLEHTLRRVRDRDGSVAVPLFDRRLDLSRAGGRVISPTTRYVFVEGNYLLLDHAPWSDLPELFDLTISLAMPPDRLEHRLLRRWTDLGYSTSAAEAKVCENDLPNVELVLESSLRADFLWCSDKQPLAIREITVNGSAECSWSAERNRNGEEHSHVPQGDQFEPQASVRSGLEIAKAVHAADGERLVREVVALIVTERLAVSEGTVSALAKAAQRHRN